MREILLSVLVAAIAYLLGCFSTGLTVSSAKGVDIRSRGSKNTGASNVLRVMGLKSGLITFAGDFLKAALACWIGSLILPGTTFGVSRYGMMLAGLFAIIGHNWPVFYGFKGGKGVACSAAVVFFVDPLWGAIAIVACLAVIALFVAFVFAGLRVSLAYALAAVPGVGVVGIWWSVPVGWLLADAFGLLYYRARHKALLPPAPPHP